MPFETVVLPRRATRRLRLARLVLRSTWQLWSAPARGRWHSGERRETYLSYYGPFALLLLIGVWTTGLIGGFALLLWGLGAQLVATGGDAGVGTALYGSGTTFFTLGLGDVLPHTALGRLLVVLEAGMGFAFLALIISYMPVLSQALLAARGQRVLARRARRLAPERGRTAPAPCGCGLHRSPGAVVAWRGSAGRQSCWKVTSRIRFWPTIAPSTREQSWLAGLTTMLDVAALLLVGIDGAPTRPARLAFAMARHAAADLSHILGTRPQSAASERLSAADLTHLRAVLAQAGCRCGRPGGGQRC
mgnify:CR=1 FL=1